MTPCTWNLRDTSSLSWGLSSSLFRLVVAVGVDGEGPDEVVTVVDVDETVDFDDAYLGGCVADPDVDEFASESDVAGGSDFAGVGVGWIRRFGHVVRSRELDHIRIDGGDAVAFGGRVVVDALVAVAGCSGTGTRPTVLGDVQGSRLVLHHQAIL